MCSVEPAARRDGLRGDEWHDPEDAAVLLDHELSQGLPDVDGRLDLRRELKTEGETGSRIGKRRHRPRFRGDRVEGRDDATADAHERPNRLPLADELDPSVALEPSLQEVSEILVRSTRRHRQELEAVAFGNADAKDRRRSVGRCWRANGMDRDQRIGRANDEPAIGNRHAVQRQSASKIWIARDRQRYAAELADGRRAASSRGFGTARGRSEGPIVVERGVGEAQTGNHLLHAYQTACDARARRPREESSRPFASR